MQNPLMERLRAYKDILHIVSQALPESERERIYLKIPKPDYMNDSVPYRDAIVDAGWVLFPRSLFWVPPQKAEGGDNGQGA